MGILFLRIFRLTVFCFFTFFVKGLSAQYKISGKVMDSLLQPLSYVSVNVSGSSKGTTTDQDGNYLITLNNGNYKFVFTIIGYKTKSFKLTVTGDHSENIILEEDNKSLTEVLVTVTKKDRAEEIIEKVIRQKEGIFKKVQNRCVNL
jgi:hypothetical protein